jgi:hypothetical protein
VGGVIATGSCIARLGLRLITIGCRPATESGRSFPRRLNNQAINTVMVAKFTQGGEPLDEVIKWAERELEGTLRA